MAGRRARGARQPLARSQHFIRTRALAAELVRDAGIGAHELVVDLGAGDGRLTAELARVARRVLAVELDPKLAASLAGRWDNVEAIQGDAAVVPLPREPFRVVANLPFSRTNDLLHALLDDPRTPLARADLIVEWGVAVKRGLPWPSTVNSVLWGAFYEVSVARRLPRTAFDTAPSVDAGVLTFRRRTEPLIPASLARHYLRFVARGFRRGPRAVASGKALARICPEWAIARDLDQHQWASLFLGESGARHAGK